MTPGLERAVTAALARVRETVAARIGAVPGVRVEVGDTGVVVSGRRLRARWLNDARLRWIGQDRTGL